MKPNLSNESPCCQWGRGEQNKEKPKDGVVGHDIDACHKCVSRFIKNAKDNECQTNVDAQQYKEKRLGAML